MPTARPAARQPQPTAEVLTHPAVARAAAARPGRVRSLAEQTAVTLAAGVMTPVTLGLEVVVHGTERGSRMAEQASFLCHQVATTARALQRVLLALAEAVDDGFLDEVRQGLRTISDAVDLMATVSNQLDQAMPVLDATTPTLKVMNSTLAQLDSTIAQLEALPGVRMARRFVGRPTGPELV